MHLDFSARHLLSCLIATLALVVFTGCGTAPVSQEPKTRFPMSVGYTDGSDFKVSRDIAPGITHDFYSFSQAPRTLNMVTVDTGRTDIHLEAEGANDRMKSLETIKHLTERIWDPNSRPLVATNASFWEGAGVPVGMTVDEGIIWRGPWTKNVDGETLIRPVFAFDEDGNLFLGDPQLDMHLRGVAGQELLIDKVNMHDNASYGTAYTWPWGSETEPIRENQSQIVLELPGGEWLPNAPAEVIVKSVDTATTAALDRKTVVIHADNPIPGWVKPGVHLKLDATFAGLPGKVVGCLGGIPMLIEDGVADPIKYGKKAGIRDAFVTDLHPRTAIGIKADGKTIVMVTVDGRQPGRSVGINLQDLAKLLQDQGCVQAMNFDGGGSTSMVIRDELVSFPSDLGGMRTVVDALVVCRTAPLGPLRDLELVPNNISIPPGASFQVSVNGRDVSGEMVDVTGPVVVSASPSSVMRLQGKTAKGIAPGDATISAHASESAAAGSANYTVAEPASVEFVPPTLLLDKGETAELLLDVRTTDGSKLYPYSVASDVEIPSIVSWNQQAGEVKALRDGIGFITVHLGADHTARLPVAVGQYSSEVVDSFDTLPDTAQKDWVEVSHASAAGSTIALDAAIKHEGAASWKFTYDMDSGGTSKIALPLDIKLDGDPLQIGVWVYGDGLGQWLRGDFRDATGTLFQLDFTDAQSGIDWKNEWHFLRASLRDAKSFSGGSGKPKAPYTFHSIYVVQPQEAAKKDGVINVDALSVVNLPADLLGAAR